MTDNNITARVRFGRAFADGFDEQHPTTPPAHDDTVASWQCAEGGNHICSGWWHMAGPGDGILTACDCWCHRRRPIAGTGFRTMLEHLEAAQADAAPKRSAFAPAPASFDAVVEG